MKKTNEKGFTIVELLVVITIIGILAAVTIPTVTHFIKPSKEKQDEATATQLTSLLNLKASGLDREIDIKHFDISSVLNVVYNGELSLIPKTENKIFLLDYETLNVTVIDQEKNKDNESAQIKIDDQHPASVVVNNKIKSNEFVKGESIIKMRAFKIKDVTYNGYDITGRVISDWEKNYNSNVAGLYEFNEGRCNGYRKWSELISVSAFAGTSTISEGNATTKVETLKGNLVVPNTVTKFNENVFNNCVNLKKIYVPETVVSWTKGFINNCTSLTNFYYGGKVDDLAKKIIANIPPSDEGWHSNCPNLKNIECSDQLYIW